MRGGGVSGRKVGSRPSGFLERPWIFIYIFGGLVLVIISSCYY